MLHLETLFGRLFDDVLCRTCLVCARPLREVDPRHGLSSPPICPACARRLRPIAEPRCGVCGKHLISESGVCMRCRGRPHSVDSIIPVFRFEGEAADLIRAYKSGSRATLAPFFAAALASEIKKRWPARTLVPVPPRPEKSRGRGWDQVEAMLAILGRQGFSVSHCLERSATREQKKLGRQDRLSNSRLSYHLLPGAAVPRSVVIIDDVHTTGATIESCAGLLKHAGAIEVSAVVLAAD